MEEIANYNPLISIILPTYNRAKMLEKAILSIVNQCYTNWELIIIDNSSIDDTSSVIAKFNDDRIKFLTIQNNGSIGKSRNYGIRKARGEWVAFIDSDDYWLPNKLNVCIECCNEKVDFVYHDLIISINGKINKWKKAKGRALRLPVIKDLLLRGNPIANSSVMLRRKLLSQMGYISEDININSSVDYNTWLRVANLTNAFKYIPNALGVYTIHSDGESQRDMSISARFACKEFVIILTTREKLKLEANFRFISGRFNYFSGNYKHALKDFFLSLSYGRIFVRLKSLAMIVIILIKSQSIKP